MEKEKLNLMLYKPTNTWFNNRKEAIKALGRGNYVRALRNRDFVLNYD